MKVTPSRRLRLQRRLGILRAYCRGKCWVCGTTDSVKTSRASYGTRCRRCFEANRTNAAVDEYLKIKAMLANPKSTFHVKQT